MGSFEEAIKYVLENEGGFSDYSDDHGGATNFGISQNIYSFSVGHAVSREAVRQMTVETAKEIYKQHFWVPLCGDTLKCQGIATALLDVAVNRGISRSVTYAQFALKVLGQEILADGQMGEHTVAALNAASGFEFIKVYERLISAAYMKIAAEHPTQLKFLHGWLARAERLLTLAP